MNVGQIFLNGKVTVHVWLNISFQRCIAIFDVSKLN